jgi:hypothetical protein
VTVEDLYPLGVFEPQFVHWPANIASHDAAEECLELCESVGLWLDESQQFTLRVGCAERADGTWAAYEMGDAESRQNGKGDTKIARALGGLFLWDEELMLWTAHEFKALDVSTPMLTTTGWSTMGDLVTGDQVFAPDGSATSIVAHPVRTGRPCFEVRLDDGQVLVADAEHLWSVWDAVAGERRVVSTAEIATSVVQQVARSGRVRRTYRWRIDLPAPIELPAADLPIAPWLFGAWLGDGSSAKGELTVGADDLDYMVGQLAALGEVAALVRRDDRSARPVWTIRIAGLVGRLRTLGVLGHKAIPDIYMQASTEQRRQLLAGIMDTDGGVSGHRVAVTMVSADLIGQVTELTRSLGYKVTLREFRASLNGADAGPMWRMTMASTCWPSPFAMPRKTARLRPADPARCRARYNAIVAVTAVPSRPTRCITVAHPSSCYLAGRGFVPTHNTANESFIRIEGLIQSAPELLAKVSRFRYANGEQAVELKSGARLKFAARSGSSGRGFAGVSTLFFDEAQHLDPEAVAAASGAMAVAENPQIWLAGSAGLRSSQQWWRMRKRALKGNGGQMLTDDPSTGGRLGWVEHTAEVISIDDKGKLVTVAPDPEDRRTWALGNPTLGRRISHEFLENQLGLLGPEKFSREHLTVWDPEPDEDLGHEPKFPPDKWSATLLNKRLPTVPGQVALAWGVCDVTRRSAIVASAGSLQGPYVEVIEDREGFGWLPARLVELVHTWNPWKVGCDGGGAERSLLPTVLAEFAQADPKIKLDLHQALTTEEYKGACGGFYTDVIEGRLARATFPVAGGEVIGQHVLDDIVAEVGARQMGQGWILDPRTVTVSIAPLKGAVVARALLPAKPRAVRKARVHSF